MSTVEEEWAEGVAHAFGEMQQRGIFTVRPKGEQDVSWGIPGILTVSDTGWGFYHNFQALVQHGAPSDEWDELESMAYLYATCNWLITEGHCPESWGFYDLYILLSTCAEIAEIEEKRNTLGDGFRRWMNERIERRREMADE